MQRISCMYVPVYYVISAMSDKCSFMFKPVLSFAVHPSVCSPLLRRGAFLSHPLGLSLILSSWERCDEHHPTALGFLPYLPTLSPQSRYGLLGMDTMLVVLAVGFPCVHPPIATRTASRWLPEQAIVRQLYASLVG